jgi:hypothetical protein
MCAGAGAGAGAPRPVDAIEFYRSLFTADPCFRDDIRGIVQGHVLALQNQLKRNAANPEKVPSTRTCARIAADNLCPVASAVNEGDAHILMRATGDVALDCAVPGPEVIVDAARARRVSVAMAKKEALFIGGCRGRGCGGCSAAPALTRERGTGHRIGADIESLVRYAGGEARSVCSTMCAMARVSVVEASRSGGEIAPPVNSPKWYTVTVLSTDAALVLQRREAAEAAEAARASKQRS